MGRLEHQEPHTNLLFPLEQTWGRQPRHRKAQPGGESKVLYLNGAQHAHRVTCESGKDWTPVGSTLGTISGQINTEAERWQPIPSYLSPPGPSASEPLEQVASFLLSSLGRISLSLIRKICTDEVEK